MNIPNSVKEIRGWAFSNCVGLKSITFPSSITKIGSGKCAFKDCDFEHIYLQMETPLIIGYDTFLRIKDTCILHVPLGSKDKYANAEGWKEFKNIKEDEPSLFDNVEW